MFYQKAIATWRDGTPNSRIQLVKKYIESVPGFSTPQLVVNQSGVISFQQKYRQIQLNMLMSGYAHLKLNTLKL
jgi:hypothetical protein